MFMSNVRSCCSGLSMVRYADDVFPSVIMDVVLSKDMFMFWVRFMFRCEFWNLLIVRVWSCFMMVRVLVGKKWWYVVPRVSWYMFRLGVCVDRVPPVRVVPKKFMVPLPSSSRIWSSSIVMYVSWPLPPSSRSAPSPAIRVSSPIPPFRVSFPSPPQRVSLPDSPWRVSLFWFPCMVSLSSPPQIMSSPSCPWRVSLPWSPLIVSSPCPPQRVSLPDSPWRVSSPSPATIWSSPLPDLRKSFLAPPIKMSLPLSDWSWLVWVSSPIRRSL